MAIKIPSKNIYEMNNPKIRDNVIDNVSVEQTIVKPNNEYEVSVYNENISQGFSNSTLQHDEQGKTDGYAYEHYRAWVEGYATYCNIQQIKIPILKENSYISKILLGKNQNNEPNFKFSIIGNINYGTATQKQTFTIYGIEREETKYAPPTSKKEDVRFELQNENIVEYTVGNPLTYGVTAKITIVGESNIAELQYEKTTIENKEYYIISNIKIFCGIRYAKIGATIQLDQNAEMYGEHTLIGTYEEYIPTNIEITIYGNTIGIDLSDGSSTYGSGKKPHSLSGNELLQDSAKVTKTDKSGNNVEVALTKHLGENVLTEYAKGKETATVLCSISDYFDENGEKVIDTKTNKMSFRLHDEVIPYVFGANNEDKPMSRYQDGTAKVFEVVGSNIIYDGAVWQELTLLEKNQENT